MLNIFDQHKCYLIIETLKNSNTCLTFKEIKELLGDKITETELNDFLFYLTEERKLKQSRVITPRGNFTAWSTYPEK